MNLPDYMIGLGGAGRAIVRTFLQEEWVMEEAIDSDDSLTPYFIDSDTDVSPSKDIDAVEAVRDRVDTSSDYHGIEPEFIHLIEDTAHRPDKVSLLSTNVVQRIAHDEGIEAWWLEDDDALVSDEGYGGGVVRRRGLTKALYHYCKTDDNAPLDDLNIPRNSTAAVAVGLGGGTGSGMLLDMAQEVTEQRDLVLFAVLPHSSNSDVDEMANAYGALVELERLALAGENPFKSIVLLSEEPYTNYTDFDRAISYTIAAYYNSAEEGPENIQARTNEENDGVPSIAPFTFAVPQIITYPGGTLDETRDRFEDLLNERLAIADAEADLLDAAESFIDDHYSEQADGLLGRAGSVNSRLQNELYGDSGLYEGRLEPVKELLESEFLVQAGYRSKEMDGETEAFAGYVLDYWYQNEPDELTSAEDRVDLIESIGDSSFDNFRDPSDDTEKALIDYLTADLDAVGRRAGVQKSRKAIPHAAISAELAGALDYGMGDATSVAGDLEDDVEDLRQTTQKQLDGPVSKALDSSRSRRDEFIEDWEAAIDTEETDISSVDRLYREVATLLDDLEDAIEEFAENASYWQDAGEASSTTFGFDRFDELDRKLRLLRLEPVEGTVTDSVDGVRKAAEEKLDAGSLGGLFGGGSRNEYERYKNMEVDSGVFDLSDYGEEEFSVEPTSGLVEDIRTKLADKLREGLPDPEEIEDARADLREELADVFDDYRDELDEARREIGSDADVDGGAFEAIGIDSDAVPAEPDYEPFDPEAYTEAINDQLSAIETAIESASGEAGPTDLRRTLENNISTTLVEPTETVESKFDSFVTELEETRQMLVDLQTVVDEGETFFREWAGSGPLDVSEIFDRGRTEAHDTESAYVEEIIPEEQGRLDQETIGETNIWEEDHERRKLLGRLEGLMSNALGSPAYLPLESPQVSPESGAPDFERSGYNEHMIHTVYMSQLFDATKTSPDSELDIDITGQEQIPSHSENNVYASQTQFAGDWDFATVTFVGRVFLDNVRPVRNNYETGYERVTGRQIPIKGDLYPDGATINSAVIRHALGTDGLADDVPDDSHGVYYQRKEFIQFGQNDSLADLLDVSVEEYEQDQYWDRVRDKLLNEYVDRKGFLTTRATDPSMEGD
ncbi:MAG: tubulin-like doman-containing protein [Halovenus sp.]